MRGLDMAKRLTLRLQIVQDRRPPRPGGTGQLCGVDHPGKVGHLGHPVLHRPCDGDARAVNRCQALLGEVGGQDRLQPWKIGVPEADGAVAAHHRPVGKGDARLGAADIGKDGKGHGRLRG